MYARLIKKDGKSLPKPNIPGLPDPNNFNNENDHNVCVATNSEIEQELQNIPPLTLNPGGHKRKRGEYASYTDETRAKIAKYAIEQELQNIPPLTPNPGGPKRKRGEYASYTDETHAKMTKYTIEHGNSSAAPHFSKNYDKKVNAVDTLQELLAVHPVVKDQNQIVTPLLQNQLWREPQGNVREGMDLNTQNIVCLLTHMKIVFSQVPNQHSVLEPLIRLANRPFQMVDAFLPTMPQDDLGEVKEALLAARRDGNENPVFYRCPSGHPYIIGNCGRPAVIGKCKECGAEIGGVGHQLRDGNMLDQGIDQTATGHILGRAQNRKHQAAPERTLTPAQCAVLRLLTHLSMYIGADSEPVAVCNLVKPDLQHNVICQFMWDHIVTDIACLKKALGRSVDDVFTLLHYILTRMIDTFNQGEKLEEDVCGLKRKDARSQWEKDFTSRITIPTLQRLDVILREGNDTIVNDKRLGSDPLLCLLYEIDTPEEQILYKIDTPEEQTRANITQLHDVPAVWRYRSMISMDHLSHIFLTQMAGQHKILQLFLHEEYHLRAIRLIPNVMRLQQFLIQRYQRKLDKAEATTLTIGEIRERMKFDGKLEEFTQLVADFSEAWECVRDALQTYIMAERQRKSVRKQKTPYDTQNPSNWTRQKLLNELRNLGINCHDSFTKATLKQLYLANLHTQRITIPNDSMDTDTGPTTQETTINQEPSDSMVRENTCVTPPEDSEDTTSTVLKSMCNMVSETMSSFRTMMSSVMANQGAQERNLTEVNPLNIAMNRLKNGNEAHTCTASEQRPHISSSGLGQQLGFIGNNGMASELLPHMDIISPSVKKQILQACNTPDGFVTVSKEYCQRTINDETPVAMLLPTLKDSGLCSYVLLHFLFKKQNSFLEKYCKEKKLKYKDLPHVCVKEVTSAHLISYHPEKDILPMVLANCNYSFEVGKGTKIEYNFVNFERQLTDRFLFSKSVIKIDEIQVMTYRSDVTNAIVFKHLREKIPQEPLNAAVCRQICEEFRSLPDLCDCLDKLDITISFLKSVGGDSDLLIDDFMTKTLKMINPIPSQKARHSCTCSNTQSLWLTLAMEKSKYLARYGKDAFENLTNDFKLELSDMQTEAFQTFCNGLQFDRLVILLEVLYECIILRIAVPQNRDEEDFVDIPNQSLINLLIGHLDSPSYDTDSDTPEWIMELLGDFKPDDPNKLLASHSVEAWLLMYKVFTRKQQEHRR